MVRTVDEDIERDSPVHSLEKWVADGVEIQRFDRFPGPFPFLALEAGSVGRHWLHSRVACLLAKGARLQFSIALRPIDLPALRIRVDVGGHQVFNGSVYLDGSATQASEFEWFSAATMPNGTVAIEAVCRVPERSEFVGLGVMFERGGGRYDYVGTDGGVLVESALLVVDQTKLHADPGAHSRHTPFGRMAYQFCKGKGLEVGALHRPFDLDAEVTYLDYEKTESLRRAYKNDARAGDIRQVQLIWKGTHYGFIDDNAYDFVINSHVLEHVANPGRMIEEWLRIIRPGGVLYMVVPDKDHTFDRPRALTPIAHLMDDFDSCLDRVPVEHYEDYIKNREGPVTEGAEALIQNSFRNQTSIHVHTFTAQSLFAFLDTLRPCLRFSLEHFEAQGMHIHATLRKDA